MPDSTPDLEIANLLMSLGLLTRRIRAAAPHDLSLTQSMVMARLAKEGPSTAADLARAEGMKPQSMGAIVASLEERGLVERKPHPTDGRQRTVALTALGATTRQAVTNAKLTWLAQALARLDAADRQTVFEAGVIIQRLVEP